MVEGVEMAKKKTFVSEEPNEVKVSEVEAVEKVTEPEAPVEVKPQPKRGKVVNCERLNVRKGPSTDDKVVTVLKVGSIVRVDILEDNNDWYKIPEGYVMAKFIKVY